MSFREGVANIHGQIQGCRSPFFVGYPPGNKHIPQKWHFENDFPFPKVGYVSSLEGIHIGFRGFSGEVVSIHDLFSLPVEVIQ